MILDRFFVEKDGVLKKKITNIYLSRAIQPIWQRFIGASLIVFTLHVAIAHGENLCVLKDFDEITIEAERGDEKAQFLVGVAYENGRCVKRDFVAAAKWYRKAQVQGSKEARHNLARLYQHGYGVEADIGYSVSLFEKNVAAGYAPSMNSLGLIYLKENGIGGNVENGIALLRGAAEKGLADASFNLGEIYYFGRNGQPGNYQEAFRWYLAAANDGLVDAARNVCEMYRLGRGVERDIQSAQKWCRTAGQKGDVKAQNIAGAIAYGIYPGVEVNYPEAIGWWKRAAEHGNSDAQFFLGMAYESGKAVPRNLVESRRWYELAAKGGQPEAVDRLKKLVTN